MSEAEKITAEEPEATLEDFVAEMSAEGEGEAESDETQVDPEQPAESEAEPEQMFEVNGEQVPVSELIGGYMKGADYTQKTQALAVKAEEAESMRAAVDRFYESEPVPEWNPQPPTRLPAGEPTGLPEFATETERMLFEQGQKQEQALAALQNVNKQREYREALQATDDTLFGFAKDNPNLPEAEVVKISQKVRGMVKRLGVPYNREVFDLVHDAETQVSVDDLKKQAVADYIAEQKAEKAKGVQAALEPGSAPALSEEPPDIGNMTDEQRDALMLAEFKSMG